MHIRSTLSDKLVQLRSEKKLTQEQIAKALGKTRVTISYYENNDRTPDVETLVDIAKFFGVTTDYLLGLSPCRNKKELAKKALSEEDGIKKRYEVLFNLDSFYKLLELIEIYMFDEKAMIEGRNKLNTELENILAKYPSEESNFYKNVFKQSEKGFYYEDFNKTIFEMEMEIRKKLSKSLTSTFDKIENEVDKFSEQIKKSPKNRKKDI